MPIEEFEKLLGVFCDEVVRRAREKGFDQAAKLWSLGEIGLIDHPPNAYLETICNLDAEIVRAADRRLLKVNSYESWRSERLGSKGRRCLGLLLLLDTAITAREEARDRTLWPHVMEAMQGQVWRNQTAVCALFDRDPVPAPTPFFKELISEATEYFGLRNMLNLKEVNRWYLTIHLQHGFSVQQFAANCHDWMRSGGARTATVDLLLGNTTIGGCQFSSESFKRLWGYFRAFRRGSLARSVVEREASRCGWLGTAAVMKCLDELEKVGVFDFEIEDSPERVAGRSNPYLDWQEGQDPSWAYQLQFPAQSDLPDDEYTLFAESKRCGRVFRVDAGTRNERWRGAELLTAEGAPVDGAWLVTPSECNPWCEPSLFTVDSNDAMGCFPLTLEQVNASTVPMLLCPSQIFPRLWQTVTQSDRYQIAVLALPSTYKGAQPNWGVRRRYTPVDQTGWSMIQLNVDDETPLELTLNGELVWRYERQLQNAQPVDIRLEPLPARDDQPNTLRLRVTSDSQIRLSSASVGGQALTLARTNELVLPLELFGTNCLSLPIRLKWMVDGNEKCAFRTARYPYPCIWIGSPNEGHRLLPTDPLMLTLGGVFRVACPGIETVGGATPFVFEGSLPVQSARALTRAAGARQLGSCCCNGMPLTIHDDLFNKGAGLGGVKETQLASCILNVGVFNGAEPTILETEGNKVLRIELSWEQLEPDDSWRLEVLKKNGDVVFLPVTRLPGEMELHSDLTGEHAGFSIDEIVACRLVAEEKAYGWWRASAPADKLNICDDQLFETVLSWDLSLRDSPTATRKLRDVFSRDPGSLLKPANRRPALFANRTWRPIDDIHDDVIRWITDELLPSPDCAGQICDAIGEQVLQLPVNAPTPLWQEIEQATRLSPQLAARLLIALDQEPARSQRAIETRRRDIIQVLRARRTIDDALIFAVEDDNPRDPGLQFAPLKKIIQRYGGTGVDAAFVRAVLLASRAHIRDPRLARGAFAQLNSLCDLDRKSGRLACLATSYFLED